MGLPLRLRHVPARLATGAFILNSGITKRDLTEEQAAGLQQMAVQAFPQFEQMSATDFGRLLSTAEIALGSALLLPVVPTWLAALGLAGFSAGLLRLYTKVPGLTQQGSLSPTQDGTVIAKDVWMAGVAWSLLIDEMTSRRR